MIDQSYQNLKSFFMGYLYQSADSEYSSVEEAVADFTKDVQIESLIDIIREIDYFMMIHGEDIWDNDLAGLGCAHKLNYRSKSAIEFLTHLKNLLQSNLDDLSN
jgi:hypothetical protein